MAATVQPSELHTYIQTRPLRPGRRRSYELGPNEDPMPSWMPPGMSMTVCVCVSALGVFFSLLFGPRAFVAAAADDERGGVWEHLKCCESALGDFLFPFLSSENVL